MNNVDSEIYNWTWGTTNCHVVKGVLNTVRSKVVSRLRVPVLMTTPEVLIDAEVYEQVYGPRRNNLTSR